MTCNYKILPPAQLDLSEILSYIAANNPLAAVSVYDSFIKKFEFLADFPQAGTLRDGLAKNLRSTVSGSYTIFYKIDKKVNIVRVLHSSRDITTNEFAP